MVTRANFSISQQHCKVDLSQKYTKNLYPSDAEVSADTLLCFTLLQKPYLNLLVFTAGFFGGIVLPFQRTANTYSRRVALDVCWPLLRARVTEIDPSPLYVGNKTKTTQTLCALMPAFLLLISNEPISFLFSKLMTREDVSDWETSRNREELVLKPSQVSETHMVYWTIIPQQPLCISVGDFHLHSAKWWDRRTAIGWALPLSSIIPNNVDCLILTSGCAAYGLQSNVAKFSQPALP